MNDFLRENYLLITHSVEILAALTGLILYKKYKYKASRYFIWFLVYLSICDFLSGYAWYLKDIKFLNFLVGTRFEKNYWFTTTYWKIGAILFFAFYFYRILAQDHFKRILKYGAVTFFIFSIVFIASNWDDFFVKFFPSISVFGAILIFLCTVFYFIEVLQSDKILTFYRSLNFYISVAIFIWWLIVTPIVFYDIYMSSAGDWNFIFLRWQIYLFANIIMYSTFTFALIWCKPEND